jgi:hypothetical protein
MPDELDKSPAAAAQAQLHLVHEFVRRDDLMNRRLGWLIQVQGLLFLALAFAWNAAPWALTMLLSALGIATTLSLRSSLTSRNSEDQQLRKWWDDQFPAEPNVGPWSPPSGIRRYLWPPTALPVIFVFAWVAVLILSIVYSAAS